jgi:hypothetical protein
LSDASLAAKAGLAKAGERLGLGRLVEVVAAGADVGARHEGVAVALLGVIFLKDEEAISSFWIGEVAAFFIGETESVLIFVLLGEMSRGFAVGSKVTSAAGLEGEALRLTGEAGALKVSTKGACLVGEAALCTGDGERAEKEGCPPALELKASPRC